MLGWFKNLLTQHCAVLFFGSGNVWDLHSDELKNHLMLQMTLCFSCFCFSDDTSLLVRLFKSSLIHKNPESWTKSRFPTQSSCYCNSELPVHFDAARFSEINRRPPSQGNTHIAPLTSKGRLCFSVLCKPVLIRYTWPSGTEAQLWLIETTNKELSLSPRSLRNRPTPGKGREQK